MSRLDGEDDFVLVLNPDDEDDWVPRDSRFSVARFTRPLSPYSFTEQRYLAAEVRALAPDVIHFPQFNVPLFRKLRYVVTIHDLIYYFFPEDCPSYLTHVAVKRVIRSAVRNAGRVLCVSRSTRDDIVRTFKTSKEKIEVTHLGAMELPPEVFSDERVAAARAFAGLSRPYLLYTGNHSPHKNLRLLLGMLRKLKDRGVELDMVITGKKDRHTPQIERLAADLGVADRTRFLGFVPDEHLFPLYRGALALIFPSLYEGFGLPPLEAFACGTPVVASNVSSIPEVLGDGAVLLDPRDEEGFVNAVEKIRTNEAFRKELVEKGAQRIKAFSWAETARKTMRAYRAMVE
jgi:glycosyltransferase involved in cell wall biosynthesis